ncbi:hypothetical protein MBOT_36390 [Mycobacterium botniense]|uniref:Uncharacterized protein n=1 Tax=Mycobacterium botniense TaxID=84962 RepID=A0A7I9Y2M2_9MYCO|nr:hypothetical protein MBOT_36390 [Mycobacterium botniense]
MPQTASTMESVKKAVPSAWCAPSAHNSPPLRWVLNGAASDLFVDLGRPEPHVLIRVGIAPPREELPAATPRRPLHDVLDICEPRSRT